MVSKITKLQRLFATILLLLLSMDLKPHIGPMNFALWVYMDKNILEPYWIWFTKHQNFDNHPLWICTYIVGIFSSTEISDYCCG